jgi:hypothetical protein
MKGGKRALSSWNIFVKKIYREGKSANPNYEFKDALRDASKRKGEMGVAMSSTKKVRKTKGRKSRARHTRRRRHH